LTKKLPKILEFRAPEQETSQKTPKHCPGTKRSSNIGPSL